MATTGARRRPQKYPDELRERAVRMVLEIRRETGEKHGAITRVASELGVGAESLRHWVNQAPEVDSERKPGQDLTGRINGWKTVLNTLTIHYGDGIAAAGHPCPTHQPQLDTAHPGAVCCRLHLRRRRDDANNSGPAPRTPRSNASTPAVCLFRVRNKPVCATS